MESDYKILRTGHVHAKGCKTDCEYQDFYVEEIEIPGVGPYLQYMHPQESKMFELPKEWLRLIRWDRAD